MSALDLLALTPDVGRLLGDCVDGAPGRLFGGHVLAQSLCAASRAASRDRPIHSAHSHFLAPGRGSAVEYSVLPLKTGRSIDVVRVDAWQGDRALLTTTASFHQPESSPEFQICAPQVALPDELSESEYRPPGTNRGVRAPFELRYPDARYREGESADRDPRLLVWVRTRTPLPSHRQIDHAALLTYAVDFLITRAAHRPLQDGPTSAIGSSIDHGMWFHRPFRVDEWLLVVSTGRSFFGSHSLCEASVFDLAGALVASGMQEALLRSTPPSR